MWSLLSENLYNKIKVLSNETKMAFLLFLVQFCCSDFVEELKWYERCVTTAVVTFKNYLMWKMLFLFRLFSRSSSLHTRASR